MRHLKAKWLGGGRERGWALLPSYARMPLTPSGCAGPGSTGCFSGASAFASVTLPPPPSPSHGSTTTTTNPLPPRCRHTLGDVPRMHVLTSPDGVGQWVRSTEHTEQTFFLCALRTHCCLEGATNGIIFSGGHTAGRVRREGGTRWVTIPTGLGWGGDACYTRHTHRRARL